MFTETETAVPAAASLRASADDEAERGARLLRRAARMRAVADHVERAR